MADNKTQNNNKFFSPDWLVRGVLTKLGDTFDKFTGRNWKPSSSLATSEIIARMKKLLDSEVKMVDGTGKFVPHKIKLKMQWDKFSTDAEDALKKLENELLVAAIDHINDNRYHTYAPLKIEIKTDYFTEGVKLHASFEEFAVDESEGELKVTIPDLKVGDFMPVVSEPEPETEIIIVEFALNGRQKTAELKFTTGDRLSVGRSKENHLSLEDKSVSKNHATLMLNAEGKLVIADTGSTNGTFINGERIAYGRALEINDGDQVKIGQIDVFFRRTPRTTDFVAEEEDDRTEKFEPVTERNLKSENKNHSASNDLNNNFTGDEREMKMEEVTAQKTEPGIKIDLRDEAKE
jgi:pSer/pThr/pTyr-binding forkhead associated (FHA) protein